jgi:long-chain acyl-CoA synthetase
MNADIPGRLFDVQSDDIVITVLPLFHVFGLSSILDICVRFGCTMSLIPRFTPAAVLTAIQRDRATIFEGVPTMFADLLSYPDLPSYDLSSLRVAISGGASIPTPVLDAFEERFGLVILEGYGMTETASTTTFNISEDERRPYSVGKAIWGTQTQVWGSDGRPLPPGPEHVGEVVTRGLHVMKGYLHNPEATASAFTGDWLHTGDLGYFDEDGFMFIVSRKKELIMGAAGTTYTPARSRTCCTPTRRWPRRPWSAFPMSGSARRSWRWSSCGPRWSCPNPRSSPTAGSAWPPTNARGSGSSVRSCPRTRWGRS